MRKLFATVLSVLLFLITPVGKTKNNHNDISPISTAVNTAGISNIRSLTRDLLDSTVRIRGTDGGCGTGVIIYSRTQGIGHTSKTYILTAAHVVNYDKFVMVDKFNYSNFHSISGVFTLKGNVVRRDNGCDLAIVEVESWFLFSPVEIIGIADYEKLELCEPVIVSGCALGDNPIVTTGMITRFDLPTMRITAPVIFGNSGGPAVDMNGRLIGIVVGVAVSQSTPVCHMGVAVSGDFIRKWIEWSPFRFLVGKTEFK